MIQKKKVHGVLKIMNGVVLMILVKVQQQHLNVDLFQVYIKIYFYNKKLIIVIIVLIIITFIIYNNKIK